MSQQPYASGNPSHDAIQPVTFNLFYQPDDTEPPEYLPGDEPAVLASHPQAQQYVEPYTEAPAQNKPITEALEAQQINDAPDDDGDITPFQDLFELRPHQRACKDAVLYAVSTKRKDGTPKKKPGQKGYDPKLDRRIKKMLVVKPTGIGKTIDMAELAKRANDKGTHCLWLIPRGPRIASLVEQGEKSMAKMGRTAVVEKGNTHGLPKFLEHLKEGEGQTVIASVPTLTGERLKLWLQVLGPSPLIIIDEAHHAPTESCMEILQHHPNSVVIGFTATPRRPDKKSLGRVFEPWDIDQPPVYEYTILDAVKDGWLTMPLECPVRPEPPLDLSRIKINSDGDFDNAELEALITQNMSRLVSYAKPVLIGRKVVAFFPDIGSAYAGAEAFKMVGLKSTYVASKDFLTGKPMTTKEQDDRIAEFRKWDSGVLCNPIMLAEGFDESCIDCVAIFRPTKAQGTYTQMVGRGTRLHPGKEHCLVVNFTTNDYDLVSLVDLFDDSKTPDEVIKIAKQLIKEEKTNDPQEALEMAEAQFQIDLTKKLQITEQKVNYEYRVYSPLAAMEILGQVPKQSNGSWYDSLPPDPKDVEFLDKYYNKPRVVKKTMADGTVVEELKPRKELNTDTLSYYSAKQLARKVRTRMNKKLCNHRQMAMLMKLGMHPLEAAKVKWEQVDEVRAQLLAMQAQHNAAHNGQQPY